MKLRYVFHMTDGLIKFAQSSGNGRRMVSDVDVIQTGQQGDEDISRRLAEFVKSKRLKVSRAQVVALLDRSRVILRYMNLPTHLDSEMRSMIDLQIANQIPYSREDVQIDYQVMSKSADGYAQVLVIVVEQKELNRIMAVFERAKIVVAKISLSSVGLWLLYGAQKDAGPLPGAIIDLDGAKGEMCICRPDFWIASREVGTGFLGLDEAGLEEFSRQWALTRDTVARERKISIMGPVYTVSVNANMSSLAKKLSADQKASVREIYLSKPQHFIKRMSWPKYMMEYPIAMGAVIGASLAPKIPLDLIPEEIKMRKQASGKQKELVLCSIWGALALLLMIPAVGLGLFKKNIQLSDLEEKLKISMNEASRVEKQMRQTERIEELFKRKLIFKKLLNEINLILPAKVALTNFSISDSSILSLQGNSPVASDINQLQKNMVESSLCSNVNLEFVNKRVTQNGEDNYFKISCDLQKNKLSP